VHTLLVAFDLFISDLFNLFSIHVLLLCRRDYHGSYFAS